MFFLILLTLALPSIAFADEASMGGTGGNVEIMSNNDIQMVNESIEINVYPSTNEERNWETFDWNDPEAQKSLRGYLTYVIIYTFRNTTDQTLEVTMGFPETCNYSCDDDYSDNEIKLQDFKAYQKMNESWQLLKTAFEQAQTAEEGSRNWYLSTVPFPPGNTEIKNTYWVLPSAYKDGQRWASYTIETGASWKDTIEQADIVVKFNEGLTPYDVSDITPVNYTFDTKKGTLEWHFTQLKPTENDNLHFGYRDVNEERMMCSMADINMDATDFADFSGTASTYLPSTNEALYYFPCKGYDYNLETAWVEGAEGDGIGEWLEIPLENPMYRQKKRTYEKLQIFNGYGSNKTLWEENNRVAKIKITFSNGEEQTYELEDIYGFQTLDLDKKISDVTSAKIEILEIYKGTTYNDTALTEVRFLGLIEKTPPTEENPSAQETTPDNSSTSNKLRKATPKDLWGKTGLTR